MKFSLSWLKQYVSLDASAEELTRAITLLGFEVDGVETTGLPPLDKVVVGEVLTRDKHPNADRLSVCTVDLGPAGGVKTIVCGAQNYKVGDRVPVALPGAVLPGNFVIKQSKIRGQSSDGMLCSAKEIGYAADAEGLLILDGQPRPELGTLINQVLPAGDTLLTVEITPNRPDALSHLGLARELAAWHRRDLSYPKLQFRGVSGDLPASRGYLDDVRVEAGEDCPLYTAHVIAGVKIGPSPDWLQRALKSVGLRPINNVVDVTNFVLLELGQPLHAFDAKKIAGHRLTVRHATEGDRFVTLDGKERVLSSRMLVIADAEKPLVVAGVMGGVDAGVDEQTTDLVLEAAYFRPQCIRWTSKRLGLSTDSSYRFERGVDSQTTLEAAYRAIDLILQTAGGRVVGPVWKVGSPRMGQAEIALSPHFVRRKLGFDLPDAFMRESLESLGLKVTRESPAEAGATWTVSLPSWRGDLDRPIDLVEEILRLHGTDRIPAGTVRAPGLVGDDDPTVLFNRRAGAYLVGQHFHECASYTLRSRAEVKTWISHASADELALANPLTEEQTHVRSTLLMGMLETLRLNQSRQTGLERLFETGRVFHEVDGQILECCAVAFLLSQPKEARAWKPREPADFFVAKQHVAILAGLAGVDFTAFEPHPVTGAYDGWQPGHSACVGDLRGDGFTARFGLMNLAMVKQLDVEGSVQAGIFVILPEKVQALAATQVRKRYVPFSLFPQALRDVALVVDAATPAESVRRTLETTAQTTSGAGFSVERVSLFDVYQGTGLPEGKKSLAFTLVYRSAERTLTDDEVNASFLKLQESLSQQTPYLVRK